MKNILTLTLILSCLFAEAIERTAISNLDQGSNRGWQNQANWSPIGVPQNGDIVIIPEGKTISVKGNVYNTAANITIKVYGTLDFDPSGTLNLNSGGVVQLYTSNSKITSNGTSSEKIIIAGGVKYNAQNDGTINGPAYTSQSSPNSASDMPGSGFSGGVLPVKLTSFTGVEKNNVVRIEWTTVLENNLKNFELQRSTDGANWQTIASIGIKNTCQCATNYVHEDKKAQPGVLYYRLRSNNVDGVMDYSQIVVIAVSAQQREKVYWSINESKTELKFLPLSVFTYPVQLQVFNSNGQLLQRETIAQAHSFNITKLPKGIAILLLNDSKGNVYNTRIIK